MVHARRAPLGWWARQVDFRTHLCWNEPSRKVLAPRRGLRSMTLVLMIDLSVACAKHDAVTSRPPQTLTTIGLVPL